ncbi:MAG: hypothetical protein ACJ8BF_13845 [Gemmatimonadales bacterium]
MTGLIFIYLVLSLVCTAVNELVAQVVNLRGKTLRSGLQILIEGPETRGLVRRMAGFISGTFGGLLGWFRSKAPKAPVLDQRAEALRELERVAGKELAEVRSKAEELSRAAAYADTRKARAVRAAILAGQSRAEAAATEATRAANERNTAQDEVHRLTNELAQARKNLIDAARPQTEAWERAEAAASGISSSPVAALYQHPLIAGLRPISLLTGSRLPSYIPADTFATALLDLVGSPEAGPPRSLQSIREGARKLPPQLQKPLTVFIDQAGDSVQELQLSISRWFSDAMERVSGVYKRRTQLVILVIAFITTIGMNADTVHIWRTLSKDATVRAAVLSAAQAYSAAAGPGDGVKAKAEQAASSGLPVAIARIDSALARIDSLAAYGVPLGWRDATFAWSTVPGWLLTALAISLGAPFWFDMLNKVMNVRAAGRAPEEKPKPPEALPPPRGA